MNALTVQLPVSVAALVIGMLVFGSIILGLALGRRQRRLHPDDDPGPARAAAGATLGLLAFLLAFTFSLAYSRMDQRKALVLEESNAIGTAWLQTDLLDEAPGVEARGLLLEYATIRANVTRANVLDTIRRSEDLQGRLWTIAVAGLDSGPSARLFVQTVNKLIDVHDQRVAFGMRYRTPAPIWVAFSFVTVMAMISLGYMFGMAGTFQLPVTVTLALAFTMVILLIEDIDHPGQGLMRTDIQALVDVRDRMEAGSRP